MPAKKWALSEISLFGSEVGQGLLGTGKIWCRPVKRKDENVGIFLLSSPRRPKRLARRMFLAGSNWWALGLGQMWISEPQLNLGKQNPEWNLILSAVFQPYDNLILTFPQEHSWAKRQNVFDGRYCWIFFWYPKKYLLQLILFRVNYFFVAYC